MIKSPQQVNNRLCAVTAICCFAALFSGCSKKEQSSAASPTNLPIVVKPTKPVLKAVSTSTKSDSSVHGNQFDFSGKKDPFKPFVVKAITAPGKSAQDGLPIHSFDVSQFRLIGVVTGGKENQAMVVDPNSKGYVLKVGMTIGKNDGRVTSINTAGVDVLEQFKDDNGRVRKENIRITLPRKQ